MKGSGYCILLVEDDDDALKLLRAILEKEGYRVLTARNGQEALLSLCANERPDVIVLDLMMPVMDGVQFRKEQRESPELASIPVLVVSAHPEAARAGIDAAGYIKKPVRAEDLLEWVALLAATPDEREIRTSHVAWSKRCSCGRVYDAAEWSTLAGGQHASNHDDPTTQLELRTCSSCRSTMARVVPKAAATTRG